jgi:hypothetical protein
VKSTSESESKRRSPGDLLFEYRFDYRKAQPNRFAGRGGTRPVVVLLDPDLAKVFKTAESVNSALRAILTAKPTRRSRGPKH